MGATIGTQAYPQSELDLLFIGKMLCMIRGPKSRAGLMAYPVGPPKLNPMANTINATGNASNEPKLLFALVIITPPT